MIRRIICRMNKDNSTTAEGEEIPCDVTMKVALIGDSGTLLRRTICDI